MSKSISILDDDYLQWVQDLCNRYRQSQIKAAVKVNKEMLRFYYELGRDISEKKAESRWGSKFFASLSRDLIAQNPGATCFSPTNLLYMRNFYRLYSNFLEIAQQPAEQMEGGIIITQQLAEQIQNLIFSVPWGHHMYLIDKCSNNPSEALFYVRETVKHGWSRSVLMNMYGTALLDRQGKGETNFIKTLPSQESDLAQEITRDPYCFGFTQLCEPYNERVLKDALITNIEKFLLELGTGFAYMGREYRLEVGQTEQFMDMLFYNVRLRCYVVVEVKTTKFEPSHIGQLGSYMVAVDHLLRNPGDNKTIGLLICKSKDKIEAQYALESSSQPISISEYELEKFYPEKLEGTIPTIEEIEAKLSENLKEENNGIEKI